MGDKDTAQSGMLQTLDLCQPLLRGIAHPSHLQRLENIRQWVVSRTTHEREMVQATKPSATYSLNWLELAPNHYHATTPHGQAVLVEEKAVRSPYRINPASTYKAQIEHPSGTVYESLETFIDFVSAEEWVQKTLIELDDPRIAEYYLDNIHFTLSICKCSLPPDVDPVHPIRLEYLEMCIDDALL